MCTVILRDGYWASIVSPLFVMLLILKGSGVPLQEKQVSVAALEPCSRSASLSPEADVDILARCTGEGALGQRCQLPRVEEENKPAVPHSSHAEVRCLSSLLLTAADA